MTKGRGRSASRGKQVRQSARQEICDCAGEFINGFDPRPAIPLENHLAIREPLNANLPAGLNEAMLLSIWHFWHAHDSVAVALLLVFDPIS